MITPGDLRDFFAAQAMQGILANDVCMRELAHSMSGTLDKDAIAMLAKRSYQYADALLIARKEGA